jgi:hypothetical protein
MRNLLRNELIICKPDVHCDDLKGNGALICSDRTLGRSNASLSQTDSCAGRRRRELKKRRIGTCIAKGKHCYKDRPWWRPLEVSVAPWQPGIC